MNKQVSFKDLGLIDYKKCWDFQKELFAEILRVKSSNRKLEQTVATKNHLIFCEHPQYIHLAKVVI